MTPKPPMIPVTKRLGFVEDFIFSLCSSQSTSITRQQAIEIKIFWRTKKHEIKAEI